MKEEIGGIRVSKKPGLAFVHDVWIGHRHKAHLFLGKVAGKIRAGSDAAEIGWFTLEEMKDMDLTNYTLKTFNKLYSKKV
jgi:ADP-ribose pyrophosphatase YjhB (NUDIX family)